MMKEIVLENIKIRTELLPGDMGYISYLHGHLYQREYQYGIAFENYVANGLDEFYRHCDPRLDRVWIAEHEDRIVGFLLLMHREKAAQLRYFIVVPECRGIGLGKKLMDLFMDFFHQAGYSSAFLWTTHELYSAAALYTRYGFRLSQEKESTAFGKPVHEQRYDLVV